MKIYQVDAFTSMVFKGNPAAICPLEQSWLPDEIMQNIAIENNLSETAFYIQSNKGYEIRWFTPKGEVDLCGHATLATAHVLFMHENYSEDTIVFSSRSGVLRVNKNNEYYVLDFPKDIITKVENSNELLSCFNLAPIEIYRGKMDYMFIFKNEYEVETVKPNFANISKLKARGIIVTAKGNNHDFVSRFFAPNCGVNEDPVTGSAHTSLVPYWSNKLSKSKLNAIQLSERKGELICELEDNRIKIAGKATTYLIGTIFI